MITNRDEAFEGSPLWRALSRSIAELVAKGELTVQDEARVVGYLCRALHGYRLVLGSAAFGRYQPPPSDAGDEPASEDEAG